jgi:hypothetical protein
MFFVRLVLCLLLLVCVGCSNRPIELFEDDQGSTPSDLTLVSADAGLRDDGITIPIDGQPPPDFTPKGVYIKLGYHRLSNTGGWAPTYLDSKLVDGTLTFSDWGLAQPPIFCEAKLTPLQQIDLLEAAETVDWNKVGTLKEVGCPVKGEGAYWSATFTLTRQGGGELVVKTSACNDVTGYPPPDLESFLKTIYQVEKDACETP